jgi:hypothetical protein
MLDINTLKEERFVLPHGFRGHFRGQLTLLFLGYGEAENHAKGVEEQIYSPHGD